MRRQAQAFAASRSLAFGIAIAAASVLSGCGADLGWNQQVTVSINTPSGMRTGSSVIAVEWDNGFPFLFGDAAGGGFRVVGEAPVVDLGSEKYLFALLPGLEELPYELAKQQSGTFGGILQLRDDILSLGTKAVPPLLYPRLVTFRDIDEPSSAVLVDPAHMNKVFGPGYSLEQIEVAITDERPEGGRIREIVPYFWWSEAERREYACATFRCDRNPVRLTTPDGAFVDSLTNRDFIKE